MSLYEFSCVRSGWMLANGVAPEEKEDIVEGDEFERLVAAHEERSSQANRELTPGEAIAANKDKVRPS